MAEGRSILHKVLSMTKVKIFRRCSTINFSQDYFRQQYQRYYSPFADLTPSYKNCITPKIDYELWF